jgi:hypothetical protein
VQAEIPQQAARNSEYVNCEVHLNFTSKNMRLLDTVTVTAVIINLKTVHIAAWHVHITAINGHNMNNTGDTEERRDETCAIPGDHLACLSHLSSLASATNSEIKVSALKDT